jgi:hypothetical protein
LIALVGCSPQQIYYYPVYVPQKTSTTAKPPDSLPPVKGKVREIKKVIKKLEKKLEEREKVP